MSDTSEEPLPMTLTLDPPEPNPMQEALQLEFHLPVSARISLEILDQRGDVVRTLEESTRLEAGHYVRVWDRMDSKGTRVPAGTYVIELSSPGKVRNRRVVVE